jgi:hypothetical protein
VSASVCNTKRIWIRCKYLGITSVCDTQTICMSPSCRQSDQSLPRCHPMHRGRCSTRRLIMLCLFVMLVCQQVVQVGSVQRLKVVILQSACQPGTAGQLASLAAALTWSRAPNTSSMTSFTEKFLMRSRALARSPSPPPAWGSAASSACAAKNVSEVLLSNMCASSLGSYTRCQGRGWGGRPCSRKGHRCGRSREQGA